MNNIVWKDICTFEKSYQVNNEGTVRSVERTVTNRNGVTRTLRSVTLKPCDNGNGYKYVSLGKGVENRRYIHRLVAEAFLDNPDNLPQINHKDENRSNNFVFVNPDGSVDITKSNLEWCTSEYNVNYGTHNDALKRPVSQFTTDGVYVQTFSSQREAAEITGANYSHIGDCCRGDRKKCGGYIWRYAKSPEKIIAILDDLLLNDNWDEDDDK